MDWDSELDRDTLRDDGDNITDEGTEVLLKENEHKKSNKMLSKKYVIPALVLVGLLVLAAVVAVTVYFGLKNENGHGHETPSDPCPDLTGTFIHTAIASDAHSNCTEIGVEILRKNGSAVDAAIATILCVGLINFQSCGIGGGHVMTIYIRKDKNFTSILGREVAPGFATEDMYDHGASSRYGGLAIAVPGEISGLWEAHQRYGKLDWKVLFQPAIKMCREGYPVSPDTVKSLNRIKDYLQNFTELRNFLWNNETNNWFKAGEIIKNPKLGDTLEKIAEGGVDAFYDSKLSKDIVADIKDGGGNITLEDLKNYKARVEDAVSFTFSSGHSIYSTRLPSSGPVLLYILNILDGYNYTINKVTNKDKATAYHRMIEAFKFAYAARSRMGDKDFVANMTELVRNITDRSYGDEIRSRINDSRTFNYSYYGPAFTIRDYIGTSHLCLLGPSGDAVSITSTVNSYFGSKVLGKRTGIVFNDEMDDFSTPNKTNEFGIPSSKTNYIVPGKMPMSSMSPSIIVDQKGDVVSVLGASGGSRITTGTAYVFAESMWFNKSIAESISFPRLHHQLIPQYIEMEKNFPQDITKKLKEMGHNVTVLDMAKSRVQGILVKDKIYAAADRRKCGSVDGW
ncbi:glutathione hydrolase 1 proenzyme-like isoform X3 [Octopus sinensis]|uniref:Glutathione hydrolase 1 proenzyme-like isoform X3 n=1 Tax=Octopus sinensis TaxID=2607531 RepID=A0A6P7TLD9_9MOLL|nr:glutathione hydrolase 1 proenzyme-like isoform X3 [Octopus sinensis]